MALRRSSHRPARRQRRSSILKPTRLLGLGEEGVDINAIAFTGMKEGSDFARLVSEDGSLWLFLLMYYFTHLVPTSSETNGIRSGIKRQQQYERIQREDRVGFTSPMYISQTNGWLECDETCRRQELATNMP